MLTAVIKDILGRENESQSVHAIGGDSGDGTRHQKRQGADPIKHAEQD